MSKFRKKPVLIEAIKWDGTAEGATPIIDWVLQNGDRTARYCAPGEVIWANGDIETPCLNIDTLEGTMAAAPGDWIIKGVQGEFYPCKPDIFEATYEPVDEQ